MQNGDEECSEASSSYESAEQCEHEQSSESDSDLRFDSDKIAEGEGSIAQQEHFIQRLAFFLFRLKLHFYKLVFPIILRHRT